MNFNKPPLDLQTPTTTNVPVFDLAASQVWLTIPGAATIPQLLIPSGTLPSMPRMITHDPNADWMSEYDLQISLKSNQSSVQVCDTTNNTSTPQNTDTNTENNRTKKPPVVIPLPPPLPPPYNSTTSQSDTADLRHQSDFIVNENIRLREENKMRLDNLQQTTSAHITALTETVTRLTNNLETYATNTCTPPTSRSTAPFEGVSTFKPHLPALPSEFLRQRNSCKEWKIFDSGQR